MKKIFVLAFMCLLSLAVNAEVKISHKKCGDCEIIIKHYTNWLGADETTYGLAKDGAVILSPDYEMSYNEDLHVIVFRGCESDAAQAYRLVLYSTHSGKCLYSGRYFAERNGNNLPWITFDRKGKYSNAVVHYYHPRGWEKFATKVVGTFFMKDGKLHQVAEKAVAYEVAVE